MERYSIPSQIALFDALVQPFLEASQVALEYYRSETCDVMMKEDLSPLTKADLAVDEIICGVLLKQFPQIALVTEERSDTHGQQLSNRPFFLVDPIDGTKEFVKKRDCFTINVALIVNNIPAFGMVMAPALNVLYVGRVGVGAYRYEVDLTGNKLKGSTEIAVSSSPSNALNVVASRSHLSQKTRQFIDANQVANMVATGSSLKFCTVASGDADIYPRFEPTMEWDTAAGHAVLRAAGGCVDAISQTLSPKLNGPMPYGKNEFRNSSFMAYTPNAIFTMPE